MTAIINRSKEITNRRNVTALVLATVVLCGAFFLTSHNPRQSLLEAAALQPEEMEQAVESGSIGRQAGFVALGAYGAYLLFQSGGFSVRWTDPLCCIAVLLLAWSTASVAWSSDPILTTKRVVILMLLACLVAGMVHRFPPLMLVLLVCTVATAFVVSGVVVESALGTFRPWASGYRFAGTVHPNQQGIFCGIVALGAAAWWPTLRGWRRLGLALIVVGTVLLLLLTKSRAAAASTLIGAAIITHFRVRREHRAYALVGLGSVVATMLFLVTLGLTPSSDRMTAMLFLGRTNNIGSLSGRTSVWTELYRYIQLRPFTGYGYDSFWTADHIDSVSEAAQWAVCSAHSSYIDAVLSTGLVGAALIMAFVVIGTFRIATARGSPAGIANSFSLSLIAFGFTNGLLESSFVQPSFLPTMAAALLMQTAMIRRSD